MQDDETYLALQFDGDELSLDDDEPSRFLFEYSGKIVVNDYSGQKVGELGTFSAFVVDAMSAVTERESLFDVFDSAESTVNYFGDLYESDGGDFKPKVVKAAFNEDPWWNPNLLILDRLIIYPEHRGRGIGLAALRAMIHRLRTGVGLIAMKPYPLQFEAKHLEAPDSDESKRLGLDGFTLSQQKATAKLRKYYSRLGFKPVHGTEYMVRAPEIPLPDPGALAPRKNKGPRFRGPL